MDTGTPLYISVEATIAADIANSTLNPGDQLPTEESLMSRFAVSRTTVRKAVEGLISRGLVEIKRGKGTFVRPPQIRQELTELSGFVEDMMAVGRKPTARLVSSNPVIAERVVADKL